jgi:hypothetical protein
VCVWMDADFNAAVNVDVRMLMFMCMCVGGCMGIFM